MLRSVLHKIKLLSIFSIFHASTSDSLVVFSGTIIWVSFSSAAAAKSLQSCPTLRPHRRKPTRLRCPWDSPSKNTGVGCHFLLQCMKVKSENEVGQSCSTLHDPIDSSPPGSAVPGIFQASILEWGAISFSIRLFYQPSKTRSSVFFNTLLTIFLGHLNFSIYCDQGHTCFN